MGHGPILRRSAHAVTRRWPRGPNLCRRPNPMAFRPFLVTAFIASIASQAALADEGGLSFWLPGNFGSFAAAPGEPGLTLPLIYFHNSGDEGGSATFPRSGRITA